MSAQNQEPVDFYFDFSSPYGYFAAFKIDALVGRFERAVRWHPMMLGAAMKVSGNRPLADQPIKGDYADHDWARMARFMELPWARPEPFPIAALAPARAFYWLDERDPALAKDFAKAALGAYFGEGRNISVPEVAAGIGAGLGIAPEDLLAAIATPGIKERLKAETDEAIRRGVFGSPFFIVDGEPFWGSDRLWMVKRWLQSGGW
ncbi:MAG: 2-hydroxychromene-2-carboxylate isomerase [Rhodospirillales bacterium]|nr:2-hydroxychromene-2-carboxylate isomerase [Rhodospirillales bacterium]